MGNKGRDKLVVIGNGMAAIACVEEIIKCAPERYEITVFGRERHLNYNRVLLTNVLTGEKSFDEIRLHDLGWYEERDIHLHTGAQVVSINRAKKTVHATGGLEAEYNKLVLATGALPNMPPLKGIEKEGVAAFRDIDDCISIKNACKKRGKAAVIGGGLLGLEAAWGLKTLGMDVTVVHLADRLMERQLDTVAADFLKEDLERLGISVLLDKMASQITGDKKAEGLIFRDGTSIEADLVLISAGIRPNAELARSSGIYCEKGIVVSDTMQTYDPAVYAAGECVQHRGETFGLVAPIFEQAKVLANHLAWDCRMVFRSRPASARLKVPGIDLYSAGNIEEDDATDAIEYTDRKGRFYKKLILKNNTLSGIIMYGDTSDGARLFTRLLEGEDISGARRTLLFGGQTNGPVTASEKIPDDAIVCGCNGVTKKMIVDAIEKKGLFTREDVKRETRASASCGGCAKTVDAILEATLGADFRERQKANICECTKYSREDVIKNIKEKRLGSVREVMETLGWETVGCEICRPALNYYVSMIWPGALDDTSSRVVSERMHANIQKDGTYSVVPRIYGGAVSPEELKTIAEAAMKYNAPLVKITGGQRIALLGITKENLPSIWKELGMDSGYAYGKALRTVKTCVGSRFCRFGTQDSLGLGIELEKKYAGLWMPAKVKMSVSGCPRNCSESSIKDIGITGINGGWEIYVGGCGGVELKAGDKLAFVRAREDVFDAVSAFLQLYREEAHYGERTFKWVSRTGIDVIRKNVIEDKEERASLIERLNGALAVIDDPWRERLEKVKVNSF